MSLRLYDTATRTVSDFVPRTPGQVGIYVCGATVQSSPHVGHLRPSVAFDVLRRWLTRNGYQVTLVRNITDIDDKILAKAAAAGVEWWAHAARYEREFTAAYDALGVLPPTYEPRATQHVTQMVELMERLVERGHAYTTGEGNVWFDVRSWPAYGELTRQRLEDLAPEPQSSDDVAYPGHAKRNVHDFALWKAPKPGEPATAAWPTPWGPGRPGWHLECSAMAQRYLGDEFDIHGGGLDLRFPHHENEQAQSRAAGFGFARRWLHAAWITQSGVKMSKSLGNGLLVSELLKTTPAPVVRYAIVAVQYRSMLEWAPDTLAEATTTWDRLCGFVERATERVGAVDADEIAKAELPVGFVAALDDDLNVPAALAVVHEHLRAGNTALAASAGNDAAVRAELVAVRGMLDVLGLDPADPQWARTDAASSSTRHALDALVQAELEARAAARAAKDWAASDAIRDRLAGAGILVQDGPDGARWTLAN
ncbi:cysteinyl-tRNA synthetase [Xylanimonas cellulosilytica DSM 15894]|uniref:Cysteine--tRNA ligase n=1 Tax=Xylanimonas cellulosilytica (strain DSM 15894 / JCM 12276 / CECT 5975 / KCTC 9989 / LMG 20990 / NBRC 107835 / XIL07) TaxID=446471 RepID=D1BZ62_XYLCX|nr:cysteine--tRNA ligase [Xylanimonas cellulosilytica]ACZ31959.1 cysteinyl-tRNA synthetase [Xylanimonas cellulosilytica DSM 15894]